jgi:hypothetical protein
VANIQMKGPHRPEDKIPNEGATRHLIEFVSSVFSVFSVSLWQIFK